MQVNGREAEEIKLVYESFINSLFGAELERYASFLSEDYRLIGTTEAEVFFSRQEAVDFLEKTADQLSGNIKRRNASLYVEWVDELVFITDLFDAWVRVEEVWIFYSKARVTSWMKKDTGNWKMIQQHFSIPDSKAQEGQTIGLEKISQENLELRDAIKRRTVELEQKNRELEVEASLERVRAGAMGMQKREDMLGICRTISEELTKLGIKEIRNVQTAIFYPEKGNYLNYEYYQKHNREIFTEVDFASERTHKDQKDFANTMLSGEGAFYTKIFSGEELKQWYSYQLGTEQLADQYLLNAHSLNYYWFSLGAIAIGISAYYPLTEEELQLFNRFRNVFNLSFRRYLDIEKAEVQAREAQIEASLERVRSRSLGMLKSDELSDVIHVIYKQLIHLSIPISHAGFVMDYKERDDHRIWIADEFGTPAQVTVPYFDAIYYNQFNEAKKSGLNFFTTRLNFEEKNKFYQDLFKYIPGFPEESKVKILSEPGFTISTVLLENVALYIENFTGIPFSDEENSVLMRFGKVFQQAYTRFLDLQKAEAQAREANIEAALEKVRSRTMAMQRSDELAASAAVMFQQIKSLGIESYTSGFNIWDEDKDSLTSWMSNPTGALNPPFIMPAREYDQHNRFYEAWKNGEQFIVDDLTGDRARAHYKYLRSFPLLEKSFAMAEEAGIRTPERQVHNVVFFSHGYLLFVTLEPKPEWQDLFKRFGQVFQQTYTRFLDLEKAEAQTIRAEQDLMEIKAARKKAEDTLLELQATQKQLIQAEKMASLGELTAGIAHEIQNPLNFVNNFSEVSAELTEEAEARRQEAGENSPLVTELLNDIKQNLSKIGHHGKRADAIVKSMLQHSQSRSGTKELTEIKELTDEYLKLAIHGYKARNKSFEVTINTSYDESIGKINIVPQEIGRVLLNLFNNAFYACAAVNRRDAMLGVSAIDNNTGNIVAVMTRRVGNAVEITVTDNGNGIDPKIIDKIFQPFFTTKPTGQGTGLGLSLAYDIIKSHNGELKVKSEVGKKTTFVIQLPIS
ncbi:ATP-binding protein [Pollutibacter soli]|uniref:ATP-binding protein n=1 Tax=Pollutibacter soli TaxID=3034157 RepID=UPI003013331C